MTRGTTVQPQSLTYQQLVREVKKHPAHASRAFPLVKNGDYDKLNLSTPILPKMETGIDQVDEALDSANRQVSGVFKMSLDSVYGFVRSTAQGGISGLAIGSLVNLLRFGFGIGDFFSPRPQKGLLFSLALPLLGFLIGSVSGGYQSARQSMDEFDALAKDRLKLLDRHKHFKFIKSKPSVASIAEEALPGALEEISKPGAK